MPEKRRFGAKPGMVGASGESQAPSSSNPAPAPATLRKSRRRRPSALSSGGVGDEGGGTVDIDSAPDSGWEKDAKMRLAAPEIKRTSGAYHRISCPWSIIGAGSIGRSPRDEDLNGIDAATDGRAGWYAAQRHGVRERRVVAR